jgi:hypothetical protein
MPSTSLLGVDEGHVGTDRGDGCQLFAGERTGNRLDVRIDLRQFGATIAAEDGAGQSGRARLIGVGHGGVAMFLDLQRVGEAVLDRIAHPAQETDAGIAGIGEDQLFRHAHADHLIVDQIGGHADQGEISESLTDRLMRGSGRDQMGKAFKSDLVAIAQIFGDRMCKRQELRHSHLLPARQMFVL